MIIRAQWRHWAKASVVYVPNAVAANILLSRLFTHTVGLLITCVAADVAIWLLMSRALGRWPW